MRDCREAIAEHVARTIDDESYIVTADQIVGELLGNVCRHAPGPYCVELHRRDRALQISVHDGGRCFDSSRTPLPEEIEWESERGRGLAIVAALGGTIETQRQRHGGCRVSVALALAHEPPGPVPSSHCPHGHPATRNQHCPRIAEFIASLEKP